MTPTPEHPPFWTPPTAMGFFLAGCGIGLGAWSKATNTLTSPTLIAVGLLLGAGMFFVDSTRALGFFREARETAERFTPHVTAQSPGQMSVAAPPGSSVTVAADVAPPAPVDRLAYNTADTIRLTALPDPSTPRRRRRKSDAAPPLADAQEHPPFVPPPSAPTGDEDGVL